MPMKNADEAQGSPFSRNFQDAVTLIEYEGRPVVVAREFGAFLGYQEGGGGLVDLITTKWSDEFLPDIDYILLKNGRLAEFKRICADLGLDLVDKRAPSLLLLTKSGMEIVLARTEKPQGKVFRRWLVSEAIPGYEAAKAGRALPGPTEPPPRRRRQVAGPRAQRQLAGPVANREDLIKAAMRATNPQGPFAEGTYFDALASTFFYAARHKNELDAGRMSKRYFLSLKVRDIGAWVKWRVDTGLDIEAADRLAELLDMLVMSYCGPVPGWK